MPNRDEIAEQVSKKLGLNRTLKVEMDGEFAHGLANEIIGKLWDALIEASCELEELRAQTEPKYDENGILWWFGIGHESIFHANQRVAKAVAEAEMRAKESAGERQRLREALRGISQLEAKADSVRGMVDDPHTKALRRAGKIAEAALSEVQKKGL